MSIRNTGTRPLDLLEADLLIPKQLSGGNVFQAYQPVLLRRTHNDGTTQYVGNCLTVNPSTVPYLGVNPLRPILAPNVDYVPEHLSLTLPEHLTDEDETKSICYSVYSQKQVYGPRTIPIKDIPTRDE